MNIDKQTVGNKIKNIRQNHNLTMEDFGKIVDAPKSAVNNWEKGRNLPSKDRLLKIAMFGKTNLQTLLYGNSIDQINTHLLKLLLDFNDENMLLSDKLSSYIDFYSENSKFRNFNDANKVTLPKYWENDEDFKHPREMGSKRYSTINDIANKINKKMEKDNIKNFSETAINQYMEFVFKDLEIEIDLTDYGMLKFMKRNIQYLKDELETTYDDKSINFEIRNKLIKKLVDTDNEIKESLNSIDDNSETNKDNKPSKYNDISNNDLPF